MTKPSHAFFCNAACQYYPCHEGLEEINCLFCFCPLYSKDKCPGTLRYITVNGAKIKDCSDCVFPHKAENYETILKLLASE